MEEIAPQNWCGGSCGGRATAATIMPERRMIMIAELVIPSLPPPMDQPDISMCEDFFNFEKVLAQVVSCQGRAFAS